MNLLMGGVMLALCVVMVAVSFSLGQTVQGAIWIVALVVWLLNVMREIDA